MIRCRLFPDEQKGRHNKTRDTEQLLYIDQHIFNKSKTRQKNLAMAWVDCKKVYDMVPQSGTLHCLRMYKISDQVIQFIEKTMQTVRIKLTAGGKIFAEVKIQRGIFHRDALSPLLFVIAMMSPIHIFTKCTPDTN